ncbi:MAG: YwiC-like family protein [Vicinamibacterales bacterium]
MAAARFLLPPEHGAWAQFLFPLATALSLPGAGLNAWLLALAALCAFLSSESLQVLIGSRGTRASRELAPAARRLVAALLVSAATALAVALPTTTVLVRWATTLMVAVGGTAWLHAVRGELKTTWGELHVGTALACWSIPVALAAGSSPTSAATIAGAWVAAFTAATLAVRSVTARGSRRPFRHYQVATILAAVSATAVLMSLARAHVISALIVATFLPTAVVVVLIAITTPAARWLKPIGWAVVAACSILLAGLIVASRTL